MDWWGVEDGTPYSRRSGQLLWDSEEDRVQCHLCGAWFRFLGSSHPIRTRGWTLAEYREAFQLRANVPTCSEQLSVTHRAHTLRRIDADEFGTRYWPAPEVLAQRREPTVPRWRSLPVRQPRARRATALHSQRPGQLAEDQRRIQPQAVVALPALPAVERRNGW